MYSFTYTSQIVNKISDISGLQSKLEVVPIALELLRDISAKANVDAVHFSTKLEGNPLTLQQVTVALQKKAPLKSSRSLKEIINYSQARYYLKNSSRKILSHDLIHKVHDLLLSGIVIRSHRGKYRQGQNAIRNFSSKEIVYLPPQASDTHGLMTELIKDVKKIALKENAFIAAAYFHFSFVTIHPYMDGNGRAARLLSNYILESYGHPINQYAALEKQYEKNRKIYYESLHRLQGKNFYDIPKNHNITSWIEYFLDCLLNTYNEAVKRIGQIPLAENLISNDRLDIAFSLFKKYRKLKTKDYESLVNVGRTQSVKDLNTLIEKNLIEKVGGGRSTVYKIKT